MITPLLATHLDIGVTIPVPAPWARLLATMRTQIGDKLGNLTEPHITLVPPIRISSADLADFAPHFVKSALASSPFRIALRGVASFRPVADVVYVPLTAGADECAALADLLRSGPVEVPLEHPYQAHVTVAHNVGLRALKRAERSLKGFSAEFTATGIVLSVRTGGEEAPWAPVYHVGLGIESNIDTVRRLGPNAIQEPR